MYKCMCCKNQVRFAEESIQIHHAGNHQWTDVTLSDEDKVELAKDLLASTPFKITLKKEGE